MTSDAVMPLSEPTPKSRSWAKILLYTLGIIAVLLLAAAIAFVIWAAQTSGPMPEAMAALASDAVVTVAVGDPITFTPTAAAPTCGFIFYPGARVDYRAYAPALRAIAAAGYFGAIPHMPLNLAIFSPNKAAQVIASHPEIKRWVVGGHSLGGAMAASYLFNNPDGAQGLALWASWPAASASLADRSQLALSSISGSRDGLATPAKIQASAALLPPQADFVEIQGGNHAQFGWYGPQNGDNPATITREEQQAQAVAATLKTLDAACAP